jgi:two-component system nitrate/nitrite response regulator NarL
MAILICSANAGTRERWKQILQDDHDLLEATTVAELSEAVRKQNVDLILLHRSMVDMHLIAALTGTRFFVFSDKPDEKEAITLLRLGSVGYANTYISPVRLKEAVNIVLAGRVWVGQKLMLSIIRGSAKGKEEQGLDTLPSHTLSEREWEVALLVSKGRSNLEIAASLNISERTVKAHISSIFKKTNTESRLQLALHIKNLLV